MSDPLVMTYQELADRLETTPEAARQHARRKRWHRYVDNDDGMARVRVPADELERLERRRQRSVGRPSDDRDTFPEGPGALRPDLSGIVRAMSEHLTTLKEQLTKAEAEAVQARAGAERAREEAAELRGRLEAAEAAHKLALDCLLTSHREEIARLQEAHQGAMESARGPWWRRWRTSKR
jgi:hypothetical protein